MDRSLLELREGNASPIVVAAGLPDRLRMDANGVVEILVNDIGWRCPVNETPVKLEGRGLEAIVQMRDFVRGMLLTPLYEMRSAVRNGDEILLELDGGEQWHLRIGEDPLLPASLRGPRGEIRFVDYRETSVTKLPRRVVLGDLGEREIQFRTTGVVYSELLFADPEAVPGAGLSTGVPRPTSTLSVGVDYRPETPEILEIRAAHKIAEKASRARRAKELSHAEATEARFEAYGFEVSRNIRDTKIEIYMDEAEKLLDRLDRYNALLDKT